MDINKVVALLMRVEALREIGELKYLITDSNKLDEYNEIYQLALEQVFNAADDCVIDSTRGSL